MLILSSGSLHNYGLNRFFKLAKEAGFLGVEVMISDIWDTRDAEYLKELSRQLKIKIVALHAPFSDIKIWSTPSRKLFESIKLAEKINAQTVILHPHGLSKKTILELQPKTKIKIAVENMPKQLKAGGGYKYKYYNPKALKGFDFLCLDTTHLATTGLDLLSTYQKIKDKIVHIHLSDAAKLRTLKKNEEDAHLLPGEGKLLLSEFLKLLKKDHYKGLISLELRPEVLGEGNETEILKRLKGAREFVIKYI